MGKKQLRVNVNQMLINHFSKQTQVSCDKIRILRIVNIPVPLKFTFYTLRKKRPYSELFWSPFLPHFPHLG